MARARPAACVNFTRRDSEYPFFARQLSGVSTAIAALMFCKVTIALFGAAIISAGATNRSYGAAAAFSDDGNHVYLVGSKLPKDAVFFHSRVKE
jgi:hypothetical protein